MSSYEREIARVKLLKQNGSTKVCETTRRQGKLLIIYSGTSTVYRISSKIAYNPLTAIVFYFYFVLVLSTPATKTDNIHMDP
jgi:hypothetical protein